MCDGISGKLPLTKICLLFSGLFYFLMIRPQLLKWGTRLGEPQRRLPGDERVPKPNFQTTRAINVDAPVEAVWPWLAQMGRDRTGWYSIDIVDNNGIPSATYIRKDLATPQVGTVLDIGLKILDVDHDRALLIGGNDLPNPLGSTSDVTALYLLERRSDGGTRLIVRVRMHSYGMAGRLFNLILEPVDFIMTYRQLTGIKARAETMAHLKMPTPLKHEISLN
jgi:hypothetical protein